MTKERVDGRGAIEWLERARVPGPAGIAFDADGTLWAGDVGEDVFETACDTEFVRDEPREGLERVCAAHGLPVNGSPSELARRIYAAYRNGQVDELLTCEVMTWSYAGHSPDDLVGFAREALAARKLVDRVRRALEPVFEFALREEIRTVVVSASPEVIVTEALRMAGIAVSAMKGAQPAVSDGRIQPRLAGRVPYGPEKPVAGRELLSGHDWLGSFGDNAFDVEMLKAARIGVAVHPKPALVARLGELSNVVVLE